VPAPDRAAPLPPVGAAPARPESGHGVFGQSDALTTTARNLSTRYLVVLVQVLTGLFMVRFNMQHLGQDTYGLWMLVASVAAYFTVMDFGYGSAVVRFVAEYRRRNDVQALNEVLSTMAFVFAGVGVLCYAAAIVASLLLPNIFNLPPGQERTGQIVMLVVSLQVALFFPFSVYGGVINGFERYHLNNIVSLVTNVATAAVNVLVLWMGYGLVELVVATTTMRTLPLWLYRRNAYRVFPALQIRRAHIRRARLRQLSGFSAYAAVVEWSGRLMYTSGAFFIGIFVNTAAVFIYSVAQRIADTMLTLTEQLHTLMMPAIVTRALDDTTERQRALMVRATRLQLAIAMGLAGGVAAIAGAVIRAWLGPGVEESVLVTQLLALMVVLRAAAAMPLTVLQGTGHPRYAAGTASAGAIVNLVASVPLVQTFGPAGVAFAAVLGTSVIVGLVFPKTCHVVGLSVWQGLRTIVLPTAWPAVVAGAIITSTQPLLPGGLVPALANLAFGGLLYVMIFLFFGLEREERQWLAAAWRRLARRRANELVTTDLPG
jgi:O-antigen/teichoic acid export membrane protein